MFVVIISILVVLVIILVVAAAVVLTLRSSQDDKDDKSDQALAPAAPAIPATQTAPAIPATQTAPAIPATQTAPAAPATPATPATPAAEAPAEKIIWSHLYGKYSTQGYIVSRTKDLPNARSTYVGVTPNASQCQKWCEEDSDCVGYIHNNNDTGYFSRQCSLLKKNAH